MRLGLVAFACALLFGMAGASARDYDRHGWRDGGRHHHYRDHDNRRWDRDHRRPVYVAPRPYYVAPQPAYQPPTFSFTPGAGISIYLPFR